MAAKLTTELITGKDEQNKILYDLLLKRTFRISHQLMPNFDDHVNFILEHPYRSWFLLKDKDMYLGSFYIHNDNSIGINLITYEEEIVTWCLEFINKEFEPLPPIKSVIPPFFYLNVSPENTEMISLLKREGHEQIQLSFRV
jgi:hypothetical protein